jgi:hypothetical protein
MIAAILVTDEEDGVLDTYLDLDEALKDIRLAWNENEKGPQCFVLRDESTGKLVATLTRPNYDPEVCITTFLDTGRIVFERCHYLFRVEEGQERYTKTEVSLIKIVENW